MSLSQNKLQ